jgi:cystathionine gamma-synthase
VAAALSKPAALGWIETPSNPLLRITDIADISRRAHAIGALVAADNTFLSPGWQQPLALGADIVVHSTTKYINGHSDVVGGAVISAKLEVAEQLAWWANCLGLTGSAFDSYLTLRGLRTLHVRLKEHGRNAQAVAEFLAQQKNVKQVYFPGLPAQPGHELAKRQQSGFGAIVTLEVAGGADGAKRFCEALELFSLAESLGGVESLVAHPGTMTHAAMAPEARAAAGLVDGLLRLSIGIESSDDLLRDLATGIKALG